MNHRLLQINVAANFTSTGKIAEQIGLMAQQQGWESWIAYGRVNNNSRNQTIRIGSRWDVMMHGIQSRLRDNHGLASKGATKHLIEHIKGISPDIIHLHNIHGYFLNYSILFKYLKSIDAPVVWTLHDCWPFTGHCAYFMLNGCERWKTVCHDCPNRREYPASLFLDRSMRNYELKRSLFTLLGDRLTLVPVSQYVADYLPQSFFGNTRVEVIKNGIDLEIFRPRMVEKKKLILGVANVWEPRKGLPDFFKLRSILPSEYKILLVGLSEKQLKELPAGVEGLTRTANQEQLAELYSQALAVVNPTYEDNYPTVNLESLACGTPVITYRTGGSPESLDGKTGIVVPCGDIEGIRAGITRIEQGGYAVSDCRNKAEKEFDNKKCFSRYLNLYDEVLSRV